MRTIGAFLALAASLIWSSPALSGPNEGGVLILHTNEALEYSSGLLYCGQSELQDCSRADTRVDVTDTVVFFVFAAFPAENSPRLLGLTFGINYHPAQIGLTAWDDCGDFELSTVGWPGPGEGVAVTWDSIRTAHLTEVYWFAGYNNYGTPASFDLINHPTSGSVFADDSVPSILDDVVDFGRLGFNTDGYLPCPDEPTPTRDASWGGLKAHHR